ncbi:MAG: M81 family metallopeptidase [Burkholderiaceae bacterium]
MRVFSATLATETNTFSPIPTGMDSFRNGVFFPEGTHPDEPGLFSGPLHAAKLRASDLGLEVFQGLVAAAQPSGLVARNVYEILRDQILNDLQKVMPVDIVLLGLHGAMAAEGYDDCEGDLLTRVRALVGPDVVIGATLDPHCHMSTEMVSAADLLICWKHYPHTDTIDRALDLVDRCVQARLKIIKPKPVLLDSRAITLIHTTREPGSSMVRLLHEIESRAGMVSASIAHGFPWGDVPAMGTKVLVYFDVMQPGAETRAQEAAREVVSAITTQLDAFNPPYQSIDAAFDEALAVAKDGPVVISDGADNPGGGAGCDSTFMLRRLIERGIDKAAVGPVYDPGAVAMAFNAGLGARLKLRMGGKVSDMSGDPVDAHVTVRGLVRQHTMGGMAQGIRLNCGDAAWVEIEKGIHVVLTSLRMQAIHPDLFTGLGCELNALKVIVVKSSQHFHAGFAPIASRVLYADAPGTLTLDLRQLNYKKADLQRWPFRSDLKVQA